MHCYNVLSLGCMHYQRITIIPMCSYQVRGLTPGSVPERKLHQDTNLNGLRQTLVSCNFHPRRVSGSLLGKNLDQKRKSLPRFLLPLESVVTFLPLLPFC